jgi:hypothetical protein
VHLSYPTFHALSKQLSKTLQQAFLKEVFSFQEGDYYFVFEIPEGTFTLRCFISNHFQCISSVDEVHKPLHQVQYFFKELYQQPIERIYPGTWDRSLCIECMNGVSLLFKMYGSRANVLCIKNEEVVDILLKKHVSDLSFDFNSIHKNLQFLTQIQEKYYIPTFDQVYNMQYIGKYSFPLDEQSLSQLQNQLTKDWLGDIFFEVVIKDQKVECLIHTHNENHYSKDVLGVLNDFQRKYFKHQLLFEKKQEQLKAIDKQIAALQKYISKTKQVLDDLKNETPLNHQADVIMANLHLWHPNSERTQKVYDFYTDTWKLITIKEKLTPQKYAHQLYQKSKNRYKELDKLQAVIEEKEKKLTTCLNHRTSILAIEDYKQLNRELKTETKRQKAAQVFPFNRTHFQGFEIWMGRNAKNNDVLTLQYAHKEDVWLHARDVSGSHVIIKAQSGTSIPMQVIEYAARIAAYYSQRKNDGLCPVSYTFKKYIRKIKGAAPGSVRMDREEVIMVEPLKQTEVNW